MRVKLEYGRTGLWVELPDQSVDAVLELKPSKPIADPANALLRAMESPIGTPPLQEIARGRKNACILICDITRPVPNEAILTPMLRILEEAGLAREDILILIATGLHRPNVGEELVEMVGESIARSYRIENHDGKNLDEHAYLGMSPNGVPVYIDRRFVEADLKITTGLIEPHLMAGYSGGRKVICPGIAGLTTVRAWHSPRFLEHPRVGCGLVEGNPVHFENTAIAKMAGCDFIVNVCIDGERRITDVVAGDMIQAWETGVERCREQVSVAVPEPVDIVVTSCAGYPLDTTFYQSVKGLTGAKSIVKQGGTIVLAASMSEGIGSKEFQELLRQTESLEGFMKRIMDPNYFYLDQWQLEELAKVTRHCQVHVVTDGLPADKLNDFFVHPFPTVEAALEEAFVQHGRDARVAVIPKGPYVLATIDGNAVA